MWRNFDVYLLPTAGYHGRACDTGSNKGGSYLYRSQLLWVRVLNLEVNVDALRYRRQYGRIATVWVVFNPSVIFVAKFVIAIQAPIWARLPVWLLVKASVMSSTISAFRLGVQYGDRYGHACPYGPLLNSLFLQVKICSFEMGSDTDTSARVVAR
jgi:hypothetical protein